MPELLQTPDYSRAVAEAWTLAGTTAQQRAHALEVKLSRQRIVLSANAPLLDVVVTEGALRQVVGQPRVMREQLGLLADVAATGTVPGGGLAPGGLLTAGPGARRNGQRSRCGCCRSRRAPRRRPAAAR